MKVLAAKLLQKKVWKLCPTATHFGGDGDKEDSCEIYESDDMDAKVLGKGRTYAAAWKDALKNLTKK